MRLVKFTVEKYRSILAKSVLPISDYTVVLGPNNQGKSNLLRGLSVALRALKILTENRFLHPYRMVGVHRAIHARTLARIMRDLYDWDADYPIQRRHDKRIKDDSKRVSRFALYFTLEALDRGKLSAIPANCVVDSEVAIKIECGREKAIYSVSLSGKRASQKCERELLRYLASNLNLCYIDAERTAKTARQSIATLVELPLEKQLESEEYTQFLNSLRKKQTNALTDISRSLRKSLCEFLPTIATAQIQMDRLGLYRKTFLPRSVDILIDDGVETSLQQKGSGVQSLIAISLAKYISQSEDHGSGNLLLAIEEPETHLHSQAIHQVKETLVKISQKIPVIITTHSPLLVNLKDVRSNVIVNENEASSAKSIAEIREVLGVQRYDNLTNAEYVIVVEGASDERIIDALLRHASVKTSNALNSGRLVICNAHGCSKMSSVITRLKMDFCRYHVILDNDSAAIESYKELVKQALITKADVTFLKYNFDGSGESELEDTLDKNVYWKKLSSEHSLENETVLPKSARKQKWSERMKMLYNHCGGRWSQEWEDEIKTLVADEVVKHPEVAVRPECQSLYKSLIGRIEKMLEQPVA